MDQFCYLKLFKAFNRRALIIPELEELEDFVPLIFLVGAAFFAEAALEGAAVESWKITGIISLSKLWIVYTWNGIVIPGFPRWFFKIVLSENLPLLIFILPSNELFQD